MLTSFRCCSAIKSSPTLLEGPWWQRELWGTDGQGGLACCDSWGSKESDMTERLIGSDLIWPDLIWLWELIRPRVQILTLQVISMSPVSFPSLLLEHPKLHQMTLCLVYGHEICGKAGCPVLMGNNYSWVSVPWLAYATSEEELPYRTQENWVCVKVKIANQHFQQNVIMK